MSCIRMLKEERKIRVWTAADRKKMRIPELEVDPGKALVLGKLI